MTNAHYTEVEQYADIESVNWAAQALARGLPRERVVAALATKSRDNARTPVQWDASPHAGFTTGTPWLPVNDNHTTVNAAAAVADPDSVFHHYRALIELRHTHDVVVHGDYRLLLPSHEQVFCYVRSWGETRLLVVVNLSGEPAVLDLGEEADLLDGDLLLGTPGQAGVLGPWEQRVVLSP